MPNKQKSAIRLKTSQKRAKNLAELKNGWIAFTCSTEDKVYDNIKNQNVLLYFITIIVGFGGFGIWLSFRNPINLDSLPSLSENILTYGLAIVASSAVDLMYRFTKRIKEVMIDEITVDDPYSLIKTIAGDFNVLYLIIFIVASLAAFMFVDPNSYYGPYRVAALCVKVYLSVCVVLFGWFLWLYASAENYISIESNPLTTLGGLSSNPLLNNSSGDLVRSR